MLYTVLLFLEACGKLSPILKQLVTTTPRMQIAEEKLQRSSALSNQPDIPSFPFGYIGDSCKMSHGDGSGREVLRSKFG